MITVRLLGAIAADVDGQSIDLGGLRQRSLFCLLVLNRNQVVTADVLADRLWPNDQPMTSIKTVQVYVSRVRALLGSEASRLESVAGGYRLRLDDAELDSARFETDLHRARGLLAKGDVGNARPVLERALALWQGAALADIAYEPFALLEAERLEELRWRAREDLLEARIADGESGQVVAEIRRAVRDHPEREGLWGQLIRALYAEGRQGEALAAFREARAYLSEELGIDPSPALQALEGAVLRQELAVPAVNRTNASASGTSQPTLGDVAATTVELYERPIARLGQRRISGPIVPVTGAFLLTIAVLVAAMNFAARATPGASSPVGLASSPADSTAGQSSAGPASRSPTPSNALIVVAADAGDGNWKPTMLDAGRYQWQNFRPSTAFTLMSGGWDASMDNPDGAQLAYGAVPPIGEIFFIRAQLVLDMPCYLGQSPHLLGDRPLDFIDWVTHHPLLAPGDVGAVNLAGYPGLSVDVTVKRAKTAKDCPSDSGQASLMRRIPLFAAAGHAFVLFNGDRGRFTSIDYGVGPPLLVMLRAHADNWDEFAAAAAPVLESLAVQP